MVVFWTINVVQGKSKWRKIPSINRTFWLIWWSPITSNSQNPNLLGSNVFDFTFLIYDPWVCWTRLWFFTDVLLCYVLMYVCLYILIFVFYASFLLVFTSANGKRMVQFSRSCFFLCLDAGWVVTNWQLQDGPLLDISWIMTPCPYKEVTGVITIALFRTSTWMSQEGSKRLVSGL